MAEFWELGDIFIHFFAHLDDMFSPLSSQISFPRAPARGSGACKAMAMRFRSIDGQDLGAFHRKKVGINQKSTNKRGFYWVFSGFQWTLGIFEILGISGLGILVQQVRIHQQT